MVAYFQQDHNTITALKIMPKMHQIAQILTIFAKIFRGGMPPDPPSWLACFAGSGLWLRHRALLSGKPIFGL